MPVPFSERSFNVWLRHLFHACARSGHCPYFVVHHRGGSSGSTPRCNSGYVRGSINTPRFHCSIGHRVDHPGGRKGCGVWILPCISASKPVTFDKWDRFPCMYEARRRTTQREGLTRRCACTIIVRGEVCFGGSNCMTSCYLTLKPTPKNLQVLEQ